MGIDYGDDTTAKLLKEGYIKTTTQGVTFTTKGIELLFTSIQEIYNELSQLRSKSCSACPCESDDNGSNGSEIQS